MCQMFFVTVLVLLGAGLAANSEIHSLTCIYTALSKPDGTPGIHKFTAMGLLDGRRIEYYDSESERKGPKQEWMKECLSAEYWGKGTEEQWLESLMNRMRQNDSVVHVLQGMRGCEGKMQPDGTLKFHRAMYMYAYDGHGLLSFDSKTKSWFQEAQLTMREWDSDQATKERIKGYLENVCIKWKKQLQKAPPPVVYVFAKKARVESNLILTCLATGFYTKDIIVRIKRNGSVLTKEDGLMSSGGLPNGDDTFQRRDHVEILKSDLSTFICNVTHEATNISVKKLWDRSQLSDTVRSRALSLPVTALLVAVIPVAIAVSAVPLLFLYKDVIPGCRRGANDNKGSSEADTPLLTAQVQGYAQNSKDGEKILLTCIARGQGSIDVEIKRNGETVTEEKGLMRADTETEEKGLMRSDTETEEKGLMRSDTETNKEIRAHVEISKDDKSKYSYEVIYKNQNIKHDFDCALPWRGPSEVQRRWTEIHNLEDYTTDPVVSDT